MTNKERAEMKQKERVLNWLETRTMKRIPLESLVVADMEPQHRDTEEVQNEILTNGILTPITVCGPYSDGTYRVIDGKRRIVAFQKLFKDGLIPCYIVDQELSDRDIQFLTLACNRLHKRTDNNLNLQYTQMLYSEYADGLIKEHYLSGAISNLTGITSRQARKYVNVIANGSEELIHAVSSDRIGISEANIIVNASEDEDVQNRLISLCRNSSYGTKKEVLEKIKDGTIFSELEKKKEDDDIILTLMQKKLIQKTTSSLQTLLDADIPKSELKEIKKLCKKVCKKY